MESKVPKNYVCPICLGVQGVENKDTLLLQQDLVYKNKEVSIFINSFFVDTSEGHVIVVPNKHYENIYDLPEKVGHKIFDAAKMISIAMKKAYNCDGITTRQNNEPAGDQHAFHYHLHVLPRYEGDRFNENSGNTRLADPKERKVFAVKLKKALEKITSSRDE